MQLPGAVFNVKYIYVLFSLKSLEFVLVEPVYILTNYLFDSLYLSFVECKRIKRNIYIWNANLFLSALIWNVKRSISGNAFPTVNTLTQPMEHCDVAYQRVLHALMLQLLGRAEQTMERRGKQVGKERLHLVATKAPFKLFCTYF